jgi:hypothetical protein
MSMADAALAGGGMRKSCKYLNMGERAAEKKNDVGQGERRCITYPREMLGIQHREEQ